LIFEIGSQLPRRYHAEPALAENSTGRGDGPRRHAFQVQFVQALFVSPESSEQEITFMTSGFRRRTSITLVPVTNTQMSVETMKELGLNHEYEEYPGVTHGPIIEAAMPDIFAFFAKHTRR
jgi:hypothetical protein